MTSFYHACSPLANLHVSLSRIYPHTQHLTTWTMFCLDEILGKQSHNCTVMQSSTSRTLDFLTHIISSHSLLLFFLLFHIHDIFFTIPPQICEPELGCCVLYTSFLLCGYFFLSLHFPFDASISVVLDLYSVNFDECNVRKH